MLKANKYKLEYSKIEDKDFKDTYFKKLKIIINQKKINESSDEKKKEVKEEETNINTTIKVFGDNYD